MNIKSTKKQSSNKGGWYFLLAVAFVYVIFFIVSPEVMQKALIFLEKLIIQLIPIFVFVFIIMVLTTRYLTTDTIIKHVGKDAGIKKWILMIIFGIISTGPIYAWYPLMADFKKQGVSSGLLATFLYNRAIKIQFLPLLLVYFDTFFVVLLTVFMIIFSILQGLIVNALVKE